MRKVAEALQQAAQEVVGTALLSMTEPAQPAKAEETQKEAEPPLFDAEPPLCGAEPTKEPEKLQLAICDAEPAKRFVVLDALAAVPRGRRHIRVTGVPRSARSGRAITAATALGQPRRGGLRQLLPRAQAV